MAVHCIEDLAGGVAHVRKEGLDLLGLLPQTYEINIDVVAFEVRLERARVSEAKSYPPKQAKRYLAGFGFLYKVLCFEHNIFFWGSRHIGLSKA